MGDSPVRPDLGDRYALGPELGRGGMAIVYRANDLRLHREVAIKVLRPGIAAVIGVDRFEREITTNAGLSHPHIVPVLDSGVVGDGDRAQAFFVMPLINGETLRRRLEQRGPLGLAEAYSIFRDVGAALQFAHEHRIVHRDVKPENVMLAGDRALLADFGIAKPIGPGERARLTGSGLVLGTPGYMSPEQQAGDRTVDERTDQYALALLLYECLTGEAPFAQGPPAAARARQLAGEVPSVHTVRPSVPRSLDAVLHRALAPNPADRFASVAEFVEALRAGAPVLAAPSTPTTNRRRGAGVAAVAAAVAVFGYLAIDWKPNHPGDPRLGLAIMPFRAAGDEAPLGETLPDLVATMLTGTTRLRVADPWALWRPLRDRPQDRARSPDPEEAGRIAARTRAERIVLGRIDRELAQLKLTIKIYGVGVLDPVAQVTVSSPLDSTAALARQAAVEVLANVWQGTDQVPVRELAGAALTRSPEALKAYLEARDAARRGQPDSADAAITRSLAADSSFGLALIEAVAIRSVVQFLRGQPYRGFSELLNRAWAAADSLPDRHRLRLVATRANVETNGRAAAAAWERLIELDSTDVEAWNGLAYTAMVYGWQFGATVGQMFEFASRAVALDSTAVWVRFRRAQLLPEFADPDSLRRESEALRGMETGSPLIRGARIGLEALIAPDSSFRARLDSLCELPPIEWGTVFRRLRAYRPDRALALTRRTLREQGPGFKYNLAASGHLGLLAAAGGWREVDSIVAAGAFASVPGLEIVARQKRLAAALVGGADPASTAAAVASLEAWLPIDSALTQYDSRDVWRTGWLLGAYHASAGDSTKASTWREIFRRIPPSGSPRTWAAANAADLGSRQWRRSGRVDSATTLAAQAYQLWTIHTENSADQEPEPAFRFELARTLQRATQVDSAAVLFRSLIPPTTWLGVYTVRALTELGSIAGQRGDLAAASRYLDWALQYLELGDDSRTRWRDSVRTDLTLTGVVPKRFGETRR